MIEHSLSFASAAPMRSNSFHSHLLFDARSREAHSPTSVFRSSAAQNAGWRGQAQWPGRMTPAGGRQVFANFRSYSRFAIVTCVAFGLTQN